MPATFLEKQRSQRPPRARVKAEAERRANRGLLVNGKPFRCDNDSVLRMLLLANGLAAAGPGATQTFRTAAGDEFTVTAAQASSIHQAQVAYLGALLDASADLQAAPPENELDDAHWPARPSVTLS